MKDEDLGKDAGLENFSLEKDAGLGRDATLEDAGVGRNAALERDGDTEDVGLGENRFGGRVRRRTGRCKKGWKWP